ncbi:MAG: response regulator, partial [Eubacterium sp.]|nr:response regulator [Eubacterium sp.]
SGILGYIFTQYVDAYTTDKNGLIQKLNFFIAAGYTVLMFINIFTGVVVDFDMANRCYIPTPFTHVFGFGVSIYMMVYCCLQLNLHWRKLSLKELVSIDISFVFVIGGTVIQAFVSWHLLISFFIATVGLYVLYFTIESPDYRKLANTIEELKIAEKNANAASEAKTLFLANMSHEIRTPINAIIGMNEMILRESKDEDILTYASDVERASKSLLSLINDILDFSKIEEGKMPIDKAEYSTAMFIKDIVNLIKVKVDDKKLAFNLNVDESLPSKLYGDDAHIKQIAINLLSNAVKYTDKGSVTLDIYGENTVMDSTILCISVKDTGRGIKKEDLKSLFDKFQRLDTTRNRTIEGTGLGLAITKTLTTMMNGAISVESVYEEGSVFTVRIPQSIIDATPIGTSYKENAPLSPKKHRNRLHVKDTRILAVDDTKMNIMVLERFLKNTGIVLDTCESGAECLDYCSKNKYDIIFLDHFMPEMDGIETLTRMKKMTDAPNIKTPVIALTANAISGAREKYLDAGFSDYLTKPINSAELEKMIADYLPEEKIVV